MISNTDLPKKNSGFNLKKTVKLSIALGIVIKLSNELVSTTQELYVLKDYISEYGYNRYRDQKFFALSLDAHGISTALSVFVMTCLSSKLFDVSWSLFSKAADNIKDKAGNVAVDFHLDQSDFKPF